jgi:integrase
MARPSYLCRREGGRYYLQIRVGKPAAALYGRPILRASLRTADFVEGRRRLMDSLGWARELIDAPDLEALGTVIDRRLQGYTAKGVPDTERTLAERIAFEHQARHYMARANQRGFEFARRFEFFADRWVDFVNQNKAGEENLDRLSRQQEYERGRAEATAAAAQGWLPVAVAPATSPSIASMPAQPAASAPTNLSHEVHQAIDAIVQSELGKWVAGLNALAPAPAAQEGTPPAAASQAPGVSAARPRLSDALALYLAPPGKKRMHKYKGRSDAAGIVRFAIDFLGDPVFDSITLNDWKRLDEAMTDIPHPKNIPATHRGSLHLRYLYASEHEWKDLRRASTTTVRDGYQYQVSKFIGWAIAEGHYQGKPFEFECMDEENLSVQPRDGFDDAELIKLISLSLFTGCSGGFRVFKPGKYYVQSHIFWGYLILILTGMRPGEVGPLKCADLVTDGENYFFDLRPFDARKGRVAIKDLRLLKTDSSSRVVPIHPLLIELGLLDRMNDLMALGETRLFPEWKPYTRPDGTVRWSQPMSKSWRYVKILLKSTRADLTLYSTRHLMAAWLDADGIAQRTRDRILGHASTVPNRYGRNGMIDKKQVSAIEALEPPVVKAMRTILMTAREKADRGELIVLKPWIAAAKRSLAESKKN